MAEVIDYGRPYIPERDYAANNYKAIGPSKDHFCHNCKNYYQNLKNAGVTKKDFIPVCHGDLYEHMKTAEEYQYLGEEEKQVYEIYSDPISFSKAEFNWEPRFYQLEMLRCSSQKKVVRAGRRSGKSECLAIKILWLMYINKNFSILVVCPFQSQVTRIFDIMRKLIGDSVTYKESVVRDVNNPHLMVLANGSQVRGFSSGAKSGGKSNQIRGQDANAIFLDEVDYLSDDDFESILAILASHPDCILWASSTPTGQRKFFFNWITNKELGFKEFHFVSAESPSWTEETEKFFKDAYPEAGYNREFLAEFGDETAGVFKNSCINASLEEYTYNNCPVNPNLTYMMGVDWNGDVYGAHIVIIEAYSDDKTIVKYRVANKIIVNKQEFTQVKAVETIIKLNYMYNPMFIYVDIGFGATQVEMLKKFGKDNPRSGLDKKVKGISMGGNITIRDPVTGQDINKPAKAFMVGVAARQLEAFRCVLPRIEDTNVMLTEEGTSDGAHIGLVQQMRNFKILKIAKSGSPTYSQDNEHTLTAWMLALLAYYMELSDANRRSFSSVIRFTGSPGEKVTQEDPDKPNMTQAELRKKVKEKLHPTKRVMAPLPIIAGRNAYSASKYSYLLSKFNKGVTPSLNKGKLGGRATF